MSRLEEKLIELGYTQDKYNSNVYYKDCYGLNGININIKNKIKGKVWTLYKDFTYPKEIDNLQQAFNEMQKDLKELEQCQD